MADILLHICCAPCSPHVIDLLAREYDTVHGYFYNPNIHPESEYLLRQDEIKRFSEEKGFPLIIGAYDAPAWDAAVRGLENEPEGGARCHVCFRLRLHAAARIANELGIPYFTTTLTVSPLKNADKVNAAGRAAAADAGSATFVENNFKKKDGFKISTRLATEYGFYRQNYCGCRYSRRG
jgi:predicted adenine nucleotide alpha hydrolase (AANH) superfamily ATPase